MSTVIQVKGRSYELPFILPRSNGAVRIFGQPAVNPTSFRLRWQIGRDVQGQIQYDSKVYKKFEKALNEGRKKVDLLESDQKPRESETWEQVQNDAAAYRHGTELLKNSGFTVLTACSLVADLVKDLGADGIKTFAGVYGPRLAKTIPLLVEKLVPAFRKFLFGDQEPKTQHQKTQAACLDAFETAFQGRFIGTIIVGEIRDFIDANKTYSDGFNKWLYCLRALFDYARDEKKALPALLPTECDLVQYHKVGKPEKAVFSVTAYAKLGAAAPDKETLLALKLVCRHHVREDECCEVRGEDFLRDKQGEPINLHIREEVSKTGIPRDIPIPPEHRPVLKLLIPDSGPLFRSKDPYGRVRRLAKKLGIPWVHNGQRHSCVSYVVYSGEDIEDVAKWDGHKVPILKRHYLVEVSHKLAKVYCSIRFSIAKINQLPQVSKARAKRKSKTAAIETVAQAA